MRRRGKELKKEKQNTHHLQPRTMNPQMFVFACFSPNYLQSGGEEREEKCGQRCIYAFYWLSVFQTNDAVYCHSKKAPLFLLGFLNLCKIGTVQEVQTAHSDNPKLTVVVHFLKQLNPSRLCQQQPTALLHPRL